jgi:hypothetical protein
MPLQQLQHYYSLVRHSATHQLAEQYLELQLSIVQDLSRTLQGTSHIAAVVSHVPDKSLCRAPAVPKDPAGFMPVDLRSVSS